MRNLTHRMIVSSEVLHTAMLLAKNEMCIGWDREGTVLEEADVMPVSKCSGRVRVDGNVEDVVQIP